MVASLLVVGVIAAACADDDDGVDDVDATPITDDEVTERDDEAVDATVPDDDVTDATEPDDDVVTATTEPDDEVVDDIDPDGVMRMAYDLVSAAKGGFTWNPPEAGASTSDLGLFHWVYGGLMRPDPSGILVPDLAEEMTIVDENTIELVIRDGLTSPDGTPFDAEAVKAGLEHNLAQEGTPAYAAEFYTLSEIDVTSPTSLELTIPDGTAAGWADTFLGGQETVIVPPGTDFDRPEGLGPFRVVEYVPEERLLLERNPDYWDAGSIDVARIEVVNAVVGTPAAVSALNAGQADWANLEVSAIDAVGSEFETLSTPATELVVSFVVCKSTEPFDDPRVRQALNMAIDRAVINETLFDGEGVPAWDLWPEGHPFHNPDLAGRYAYDPESARELLADAGLAEGFSFDVIPIPASGMPELAQIVQQQFADIGVTMEINQSQNFVEDLYINNAVPLGLIPLIGADGVGKMRQWVGDSIGNICGYEDPELTRLTGELSSVSSDSDEAVELWHEIQEIVVEDALSILVLFQPRVVAYDPEVLGGVATAYYTIPVPDIYNLYVKG